MGWTSPLSWHALTQPLRCGGSGGGGGRGVRRGRPQRAARRPTVLRCCCGLRAGSWARQQ